jgi:hypothetical protein
MKRKMNKKQSKKERKRKREEGSINKIEGKIKELHPVW